MNKKLFFGMFAAGMLFATSCSNDDLTQVLSSEYADVSISLGIDEVAGSRAISDGKGANELHYAVFDKDGKRISTITAVHDKEVTFPTTETITLAKGQTYKVAFWAQNKACTAYTVSDEMNVTVDYTGANNDETRDAFFKTVQFTVNGSTSLDVELKRPFAQINVGVEATDWNAAVASGVEIEESNVTIENAATSINLVTGKVDGSVEVDYTTAAIPAEPLKANNSTYNWLSMSYILVNDGSETGDAETTLKSLKYTFTPESGYAITFSEGLNNVPVRRNWRTNILGKILTGDIQFNISIDPIYDGDIIYPSEQEQELEFAASFGGTVTLTEDVTLTEPLVVGADMILNIAEGKTLTGSINVAEGATLAVNGGAIQNGNSAVSGITSVGDLTLNDVTITSARHGVRIEGGNAIINGGNYSVSETAGMTHHALNVSGNSNVIIKGGTFAGPGKNTADDSGSAVKVQSGSTVTIEGGDFSGGKNSTLSSEGTLSINGGTFDQEPKADWIADGYKSIESNGTYYVVSNDVEGVSNEAELKSALEAAKKNILLLNNIALSEAITVSNDFSLKSNGLEITNNNGAVFAIADNANVTITIKDAAKFTGSTDGITVPKGETLTINGAGNLVVEGKAGSGIGYGVKGEEIGTININGLAHITAKGNGVHAFGIGGNGADVLIKNSTVDYACGGYIQPLFVSDTKYGKSEPEGGAAIGGETIKIEGSIITKAEGGSKAAAIGAQYWQSTKIEIINSTILEAIGGNASAGIGGSRYSSDISETNKQSVKIHIENSNVTANGGQAGAGIGSGYDTHCAANDVNAVNDIVIKNSTVTAKGGKYAAGIGTGYHAAALTGSIDAASTVNAASGEKFYKDTYSTAQDIGYGVVDPVREYAGATVTFTVNEKVIAAPWGDVKIGDNYYATLAAAAAAAKAGETITITSDVTLDESLTLPAGITLNGNGKQIDGTIYAGGDLTFVGHTKVTGFSATYYDRTITIGEGACLEVTGTGRTTLAYGNVFNVTGSVTNAKSVDKTTIQPSLIIPAGISITGGNDATMNIKNAYVQIGSTTSKPDAADGTFTLNIENSIAEFTKELGLYEPTGGKNPTFNVNVKNSVLTTVTKLCIAAPNSNVVFDNSTVTLGSYIRNSGTVTLKNGSTLTGSTIQFGENGGDNGTINVDASTLTVNATSTGHAFDGKDTGSINLTNGAEASVTYYKAMTISKDETSTFTGTEVN